MAVLEQIAKDIRDDVAAVRGDIEGLNARLRGVEVSNGRLEGKIDALTDTIVGQTSAALAKLPSWWQMPALAAAVVALGVAAITGIEFLQTHGFL